MIKKIMNSDVKFICDKKRMRPKKSEVLRLWCDNSKIKELTNFKPIVGISDGLKQTVEWTLKPNNLAKYKAEIFNI